MHLIFYLRCTLTGRRRPVGGAIRTARGKGAPYRTNDTPAKARVREGIAHARMWRMDGKDKHRPEAIRILTSALAVWPDSVAGWGELGKAGLGEVKVG